MQTLLVCSFVCVLKYSKLCAGSSPTWLVDYRWHVMLWDKSVPTILMEMPVIHDQNFGYNKSADSTLVR